MSKFKEMELTVDELLANMKSDKKREDAYKLLEIFSNVSGYEGKVWYPGLIGFGRYEYKYETGRQGVATILAFTPRDTKFSIHVGYDFKDREELLSKLGKFKLGAGCIYINKLEDIDVNILEQILTNSIDFTKKTYTIL